MSPASIHADNRRITARVVLFMVVAVTLTLVLFAGGPTGAISFAQQQTTSPGPTIKWLNPDAETSNEISSKPDRSGVPTGGSYHLVATVNEVPANAVVSFLYQSGTNTPLPIGTATLVGSDTYHHHWGAASDNPIPADGEYTLIAVLSSSGQEVSRDEEDVVVNNADEDPPANIDPTTAQAETVEIVDPAVVDVLGFYDRPGDPRYTAVLRISMSDGVTDVLPYYTTSAPGTEPNWVECESGSQTRDEATDGVQCELADPTTPTQVTGVAVVAFDDPTAPAPAPGPNRESGDAHRVTGYEAIPTTITLSGATGQQTQNTCTPVITATLFDQNGNTVSGANVDVHAQGPSDGLQFDDSGDASGNDSSPHKAPEGHTTQPARDCESTSNPPATGGSQGFHAETGSDRKHIESTDGTTDSGTFRFRLFSPVSGVTQYTVWSDDDGNDRLCSLEAQEDGSIGWGQARPAPTGVAAEDTTCVRPGQSSTTPAGETSTTPVSESPSSVSPSPSPSTTSPSPTASSASPTATTTSSPSPTETVTPPPDRPTPVASSVSGKSTRKGFNGQVSAAKKKCEKRRLVKVKKAGKGVIGRDRTNKAGNWKLKRPNAKGRFHAVVTPKKFTNKRGETFKCTKDRSPFFRRKG